LKSFSFEILWENFFLENLGDSKLTSSLHLKTFELFDLIVEIEHNVPFLQQLSRMLLYVKRSCFLFFFGSGNHHCLIGAINFKENSHFLSGAILPLFSVLEPLILIVGVLVVNKVIENVARI
jgi:hypothetical protein